MLEIGLFHDGASSLPLITDKKGVTFNDETLAPAAAHSNAVSRPGPQSQSAYPVAHRQESRGSENRAGPS
jgi:hypothetical protein